MNMAGVVAGPKSVTETPFDASPAASAAASAGPDSLGSRPTCQQMQGCYRRGSHGGLASAARRQRRPQQPRVPPHLPT